MSSMQYLFSLVLLSGILQRIEGATRATPGYDAALGHLSNIPVYQTDIESALYNPSMWRDLDDESVDTSLPYAWQNLFDLIPVTEVSEAPQEPLVFRAMQYAGWQVHTVTDLALSTQTDGFVNLNRAIFNKAISKGPLGNLISYLASGLNLQFIVFSKNPFYISSNRPKQVSMRLPRIQDACRDFGQWTEITIIPSNKRHTATYSHMPLMNIHHANPLFLCFTPPLRDQFHVFTRLVAGMDGMLARTSTLPPVFLLEFPRFSLYPETPSDAIAALLRFSAVATLLSDQTEIHDAFDLPRFNLLVPRSTRQYVEARKTIMAAGAQSFIIKDKVKPLSAVFSSIAASTNFVDIELNNERRTPALHLYRLQSSQDIAELNMTVMFTCPNEKPHLVRMVRIVSFLSSLMTQNLVLARYVGEELQGINILPDIILGHQLCTKEKVLSARFEHLHPFYHLNWGTELDGKEIARVEDAPWVDNRYSQAVGFAVDVLPVADDQGYSPGDKIQAAVILRMEKLAMGSDRYGWMASGQEEAVDEELTCESPPSPSLKGFNRRRPVGRRCHDRFYHL